MARRLHALTGEDVTAINSGLARANNNPLGRRGAKAERRVSTTSRDAYKGYFKAIDTSGAVDQKIKIVNGYDITLPQAGYATINDTVFSVDVDELVITGDAFIYLQAVYNTETETTEEPTFEQSSSFPTYEANKLKKLLCNVEFADSSIVDIIQQHHDGAIIGQTFGDCE